jgi:hypothetical protein
VAIDELIRIVAGRRLQADFDSGRSYDRLRGTALALPVDAARRPDEAALAHIASWADPSGRVRARAPAT